MASPVDAAIADLRVASEVSGPSEVNKIAAIRYVPCSWHDLPQCRQAHSR